MPLYSSCPYTTADLPTALHLLVAYRASEPARRVGWVDYVGTLATQQRKGLGRALLAGLRQLHTLGADTALLITMEANAGAQSVYTALGFAIAEHDLAFVRVVG